MRSHMSAQDHVHTGDKCTECNEKDVGTITKLVDTFEADQPKLEQQLDKWLECWLSYVKKVDQELQGINNDKKRDTFLLYSYTKRKLNLYLDRMSQLYEKAHQRSQQLVELCQRPSNIDDIKVTLLLDRWNQRCLREGYKISPAKVKELNSYLWPEMERLEQERIYLEIELAIWHRMWQKSCQPLNRIRADNPETYARLHRAMLNVRREMADLIRNAFKRAKCKMEDKLDQAVKTDDN